MRVLRTVRTARTVRHRPTVTWVSTYSTSILTNDCCPAALLPLTATPPTCADKWQAQPWINGKLYHAGVFDTDVEAWHAVQVRTNIDVPTLALRNSPPLAPPPTLRDTTPPPPSTCIADV